MNHLKDSEVAEDRPDLEKNVHRRMLGASQGLFGRFASTLTDPATITIYIGKWEEVEMQKSEVTGRLERW